jgi:tetratricopeptide (TPR) repeat protein
MNPTEKTGGSQNVREGVRAESQKASEGAQAAGTSMSESASEQISASSAEAARRSARRDALLALVVVAGLASVFALSRWLDARRPPEDPFQSYEEQYVKPETARRLSLGFNGLVADWYWLRSLQYVGRKVDAYHGEFTLDDMRPLGIRSLGPLLDEATTLDPQFTAAYEFGAVVLPSIDRDAAIRLVEKGIRDNPRDWRLYHHLGYIYWQAGRFPEAAAAYSEGARLPGAPGWMNVMAAQLQTEGGSRNLAREMYRRMYEEASDAQVKALAVQRLAQLDSLDQRDALRRTLSDFRARAGRCPSAWREVATALRAARFETDSGGAPLDPAGFPYVLDSASCEARLDEHSPIPKK